MLPLAFSDRQKSIVAAALTTVSMVVMVVVVFWLFRLALDFFIYFSSVFLPLAVAAILATLMRPYYLWLYERLKSNVLALIIVIASLVLPVVFIFYHFGVLLLSQVSSLLAEFPVWVEKIQLFVQEHLPAMKEWVVKYDLKARLTAFIEGRSDLLTSSASAITQGFMSTGSALFKSVAGFLSWLVMPVYFAFMIQAPVLHRGDLEQHLPFLKPKTRQDVIYLVTEFASILVAFFRGQFVVAACQGILFAIGFAIVGLQHGVILGLMLGMLNIVPYLGNIIGLAVVIPLAWFHPFGGPAVLAGVAIVFVIVQVVESYILTPKIMGKTTGLHPMAIIFAILFWGTAFSGLLGMILAIPLTAFLVVFWRLLKTRYIKEWL